MALLPRLISLQETLTYLNNMDHSYFMEKVEPYLTKIPTGNRETAFDRHELDKWVDNQNFHAHIPIMSHHEKIPRGVKQPHRSNVQKINSMDNQTIERDFSSALKWLKSMPKKTKSYSQLKPNYRSTIPIHCPGKAIKMNGGLWFKKKSSKFPRYRYSNIFSPTNGDDNNSIH
ncbi:MAG: hypothetical protein GY770_18960 [Aestuariibacter sp.]|nr:hypothetical protein [Aestuariibacter sp.]